MEDRVAFVKEMHLLKTDLFMNLIEQGQLPLRPGVARIISTFHPLPSSSLIWVVLCVALHTYVVPIDLL